MIVSAILVVVPIAAAPQIQYFYALLFIFAGLIFYVPFVYYKKTVPGMSKLMFFFEALIWFNIVPFLRAESFTIVSQKLLQIAPTTSH